MQRSAAAALLFEVRNTAGASLRLLRLHQPPRRRALRRMRRSARNAVAGHSATCDSRVLHSEAPRREDPHVPGGAGDQRCWLAGLAMRVSYIALLLPVLGLIHKGAQIAADRYTYAAAAPPALLIGSEQP